MNSHMIWALLTTAGLVVTTIAMVDDGPNAFSVSVWAINLFGLVLNSYFSGRADA